MIPSMSQIELFNHLHRIIIIIIINIIIIIIIIWNRAAVCKLFTLPRNAW